MSSGFAIIWPGNKCGFEPPKCPLISPLHGLETSGGSNPQNVPWIRHYITWRQVGLEPPKCPLNSPIHGLETSGGSNPKMSPGFATTCNRSGHSAVVNLDVISFCLLWQAWLIIGPVYSIGHASDCVGTHRTASKHRNIASYKLNLMHRTAEQPSRMTRRLSCACNADTGTSSLLSRTFRIRRSPWSRRYDAPNCCWLHAFVV